MSKQIQNLTTRFDINSDLITKYEKTKKSQYEFLEEQKFLLGIPR